MVVFIDENSQTCDRVACRLEGDGYHVLTAVTLLQGLELAEMRAPDALVWSDGVDGDHHWTVCHFLRSQLPRQTRADPDSQANAGHVLVVHESSDPDQLATVLDELFEGPAAPVIAQSCNQPSPESLMAHTETRARASRCRLPAADLADLCTAERPQAPHD